MATPTKPKARLSEPGSISGAAPIIVERRELIARIEPSPHGELSMLQAAFVAAAGAMEMRLEGEGDFDRIELVHDGTRFQLSAEPVEFAHPDRR